MRAALAALLLACATSALAQGITPGNLLFELIDQLQTGRSRPVLYGPDVQRTVAEQTNDTGIYQSLRRLGPVTGTRIDRTENLNGGVLYYMTATHQSGISTWAVGYSTRTQRIEYIHFTVGPGATQPPSLPPAPPPQSPPPQATPQTPPGKKPIRSAGPTPQPPAQPPVLPPAQPPVQPTSTPTPPAGRTPTSDTSEACRKFPNLC
jgi:hypothetical protein